MLLSLEAAAFLSNKLAFVSSIACILVLILIITKPPKNVGNYRYCYYILSTIECISSISHYFGAPCFFVNGDTLLTFAIDGPMIAHITWMTAYHGLEVMLTACFVYRYATVCRSSFLINILHSKWLFPIALSLLIGTVAVMTCIFYLFYVPTEELKQRANEVLADAIAIDFRDHFVAGFDYKIGNPYLSLEIFQMGHVISTIQSLGFVSTMSFCAAQIYRYIKKNSLSASQTKLHKRVLWLLVQQAIVPFCFVFTLAMFCEISILIRVDISFLAPIFTLTTSIPPLCSCISVIGLTSEYRRMFIPKSTTTTEATSRMTTKRDRGK